MNRRRAILTGALALTGGALVGCDSAADATPSATTTTETLQRVDLPNSPVMREAGGLRPFRESGFLVRTDRSVARP